MDTTFSSGMLIVAGESKAHWPESSAKMIMLPVLTTRRPSAVSSLVDIVIQTPSSSPNPSSFPSVASSGVSRKLSRKVHRSSRNCRASSLSTHPIVAQSIFRRTHWPTKSAYCVNRRGNAHPDSNVDTIGTDRVRVMTPRSERRSSALKPCARKNDGKEDGTGYSIATCELWERAQCRLGSDVHCS